MKSNRYGVELAHALITTSLFQHNEKIRAKLENRCVLPINAFQSVEHETTELFGLCGSQVLHPQPCKEVINKVNMDTLKYNELQGILHMQEMEVVYV